jgi:hypothetical protein
MDDLFQIAGLRRTQRDKILTGGFDTLRDFSEASREDVRRRVSPVSERDTLEGLHLQALSRSPRRTTPAPTGL